MAVGYSSYPNAAVALSGTTVKTVLKAAAPAGHGLLVAEFAISFDGVTSSAVPALVELCYSTEATNATAGTQLSSPPHTRGRSSGGSVPTVYYNFTSEPTVLTPIKGWLVSQYMGLLILQHPLGRELENDSSGGGTDGYKAIAVRVTPTASVNCRVYMDLEAIG